MLPTLAMLAMLIASLCVPAMAATYYVSTAGSDSNAGTSPEAAWATLRRVNAAPLLPGDKVLLRRGDQWRGSLRPKSGHEGAPITYGAYGTGPKPVILGSVDRSNPADWKHEGGALWSTGGNAPVRPAVLPPDIPPGKPLVWSLHQEAGAVARLSTTQEGGGGAGLRIDCDEPAKAGNHIQLIATGIPLVEGQAYRLALRARCTQPFRLGLPQLMSVGPPWTGYSSGPPLRAAPVGTDWQVLTQFYRASRTTDNARLTVYLGRVLPRGASLSLDSISFLPCPAEEFPRESIVPVDVGNIIFGEEAACGWKVWEKQDLTAQGRYWYDEDAQALWIYSAENPAVHYQRLECALREHIILQNATSYVIYENLALKYGAAHGIGGGATHHIIARDLDISYIGGGDQMGGDRTVRFGNGIEFWGAAHDNLVERCRLWEIYDAALTNQNGGAPLSENNITYRYNVIWNSEYSFEYWNGPATSDTHDIYFVNNTCLHAGHGWGHAQRPDPSGRHLCFYTSPAPARNIVIRNNIFYEATKNAFYAPAWPREAIDALCMDNNLWVQQTGTMISFKGKAYTMAEFAKYQADYAKEPHSLTVEPGFVDMAGHDFRLAPGSPCIDAGMDLGPGTDFEGTPVPQGPHTDIGAYERK